jgi:hypothetical protein
MNPGLKKIVFRKLNQDLSKVEIILSENKSIWFIDRANKYWFFELEKSGKLWWRYEFFTEFFILFSLEINEFQPLLSEWVEGVLNCEVNMIPRSGHRLHSTVEGILNHGYRKGSRKVDEVLNHKVVTTEYCGIIPSYDLEEVLNREINKIDGGELFDNSTLEKVLNHKVVSISHANEQNELIQQILVHELIYEVESAAPLDTPAHDSVDEVLSYKVTRAIPDLNESLADVEIILNQKS